MVGFVGTPPFRRIALCVAIDTMCLNIAKIFFPVAHFWGHAWGPYESLTPMITFPRLAR